MHTYIQRSCHPNLNPIYHQTNGVFSIRAEGGWHVHFMHPRRLANSTLLCSHCVSLLSLLSHTPPCFSSSHHCTALNVSFFICLFIYLLFFI